MKHITYHANDVPVLPFLMDRRRTPDRRARWRGGRRDADWQKRPSGGWARVARREPHAPRWTRLLTALNIW